MKQTRVTFPWIFHLLIRACPRVRREALTSGSVFKGVPEMQPGASLQVPPPIAALPFPCTHSVLR